MRYALFALLFAAPGFAESHAPVDLGEERPMAADGGGTAKAPPSGGHWTEAANGRPEQVLVAWASDGSQNETRSLMRYDGDFGPGTIVLQARADANGGMGIVATQARNAGSDVHLVGNLAELEAAARAVQERIAANPMAPPHVVFAVHGEPGRAQFGEEFWLGADNAYGIGRMFNGVASVRFHSCSFGAEPTALRRFAQGAEARTKATDQTIWNTDQGVLVEASSNWVFSAPSNNPGRVKGGSAPTTVPPPTVLPRPVVDAADLRVQKLQKLQMIFSERSWEPNVPKPVMYPKAAAAF